MKKSPFVPKTKKEYLSQFTEISKYNNQTDKEKEDSEECQQNEASNFQNISYKNSPNGINKDEITKEFDYSFRLKKPEEYQLQLRNLEEKIYEIQNSLYDQTLKNADLEYKLKESQIFEHKTVQQSEDNAVNIEKLKKLEILLKHSRKQNLIYSDEIKDLKKNQCDQYNLTKELEYLKYENLTLKAFIVAQNKMTHYRHAFENLKIENYCQKCAESILNEYVKSSDPIQDVSNEDIHLPEVNKSRHKNVIDLLKNSSTYTIQLNNNGDRLETMEHRHIRAVSEEVVPYVNKTSLRLLMEKIDLPVNTIDSVARTVIHLGDQIFIRVDWDNDENKRATVKYIGNLDERYQNKLFLGVKLNLKISEIPRDFQNNGCFRNKRYFSLNSNNGYFLHFSNIVSIYNKESNQFEDFEDYLLQKIDPKANRNTRKNNYIKRLNET